METAMAAATTASADTVDTDQVPLTAALSPPHAAAVGPRETTQTVTAADAKGAYDRLNAAERTTVEYITRDYYRLTEEKHFERVRTALGFTIAYFVERLQYFEGHVVFEPHLDSTLPAELYRLTSATVPSESTVKAQQALNRAAFQLADELRHISKGNGYKFVYDVGSEGDTYDSSACTRSSLSEVGSDTVFGLAFPGLQIGTLRVCNPAVLLFSPPHQGKGASATASAPARGAAASHAHVTPFQVSEEGWRRAQEHVAVAFTRLRQSYVDVYSACGCMGETNGMSEALADALARTAAMSLNSQTATAARQAEIEWIVQGTWAQETQAVPDKAVYKGAAEHAATLRRWMTDETVRVLNNNGKQLDDGIARQLDVLAVLLFRTWRASHVVFGGSKLYCVAKHTRVDPERMDVGSRTGTVVSATTVPGLERKDGTVIHKAVVVCSEDAIIKWGPGPSKDGLSDDDDDDEDGDVGRSGVSIAPDVSAPARVAIVSPSTNLPQNPGTEARAVLQQMKGRVQRILSEWADARTRIGELRDRYEAVSTRMWEMVEPYLASGTADDRAAGGALRAYHLNERATSAAHWLDGESAWRKTCEGELMRIVERTEAEFELGRKKGTSESDRGKWMGEIQREFTGRADHYESNAKGLPVLAENQLRGIVEDEYSKMKAGLRTNFEGYAKMKRKETDDVLTAIFRMAMAQGTISADEGKHRERIEDIQAKIAAGRAAARRERDLELAAQDEDHKNRLAELTEDLRRTARRAVMNVIAATGAIDQPPPPPQSQSPPLSAATSEPVEIVTVSGSAQPAPVTPVAIGSAWQQVCDTARALALKAIGSVGATHAPRDMVLAINVVCDVIDECDRFVYLLTTDMGRRHPSSSVVPHEDASTVHRIVFAGAKVDCTVLAPLMGKVFGGSVTPLAKRAIRMMGTCMKDGCKLEAAEMAAFIRMVLNVLEAFVGAPGRPVLERVKVGETYHAATPGTDAVERAHARGLPGLSWKNGILVRPSGYTSPIDYPVVSCPAATMDVTWTHGREIQGISIRAQSIPPDCDVKLVSADGDDSSLDLAWMRIGNSPLMINGTPVARYWGGAPCRRTVLLVCNRKGAPDWGNATRYRIDYTVEGGTAKLSLKNNLEMESGTDLVFPQQGLVECRLAKEYEGVTSRYVDDRLVLVATSTGTKRVAVIGVASDGSTDQKEIWFNVTKPAEAAAVDVPPVVAQQQVAAVAAVQEDGAGDTKMTYPPAEYHVGDDVAIIPVITNGPPKSVALQASHHLPPGLSIGPVPQHGTMRDGRPSLDYAIIGTPKQKGTWRTVLRYETRAGVFETTIARIVVLPLDPKTGSDSRQSTLEPPPPPLRVSRTRPTGKGGHSRPTASAVPAPPVPAAVPPPLPPPPAELPSEPPSRVDATAAPVTLAPADETPAPAATPVAQPLAEVTGASGGAPDGVADEKRTEPHRTLRAKRVNQPAAAAEAQTDAGMPVFTETDSAILARIEYPKVITSIGNAFEVRPASRYGRPAPSGVAYRAIDMGNTRLQVDGDTGIISGTVGKDFQQRITIECALGSEKRNVTCDLSITAAGPRLKYTHDSYVLTVGETVNLKPELWPSSWTYVDATGLPEGLGINGEFVMRGTPTAVTQDPCAVTVVATDSRNVMHYLQVCEIKVIASGPNVTETKGSGDAIDPAPAPPVLPPPSSMPRRHSVGDPSAEDAYVAPPPSAMASVVSGSPRMADEKAAPVPAGDGSGATPPTKTPVAVPDMHIPDTASHEPPEVVDSGKPDEDSGAFFTGPPVLHPVARSAAVLTRLCRDGKYSQQVVDWVCKNDGNTMRALVYSMETKNLMEHKGTLEASAIMSEDTAYWPRKGGEKVPPCVGEYVRRLVRKSELHWAVGVALAAISDYRDLLFADLFAVSTVQWHLNFDGHREPFLSRALDSFKLFCETAGDEGGATARASIIEALKGEMTKDGVFQGVFHAATVRFFKRYESMRWGGTKKAIEEFTNVYLNAFCQYQTDNDLDAEPVKGFEIAPNPVAFTQLVDMLLHQGKWEVWGSTPIGPFDAAVLLSDAGNSKIVVHNRPCVAECTYVALKTIFTPIEDAADWPVFLRILLHRATRFAINVSVFKFDHTKNTILFGLVFLCSVGHKDKAVKIIDAAANAGRGNLNDPQHITAAAKKVLTKPLNRFMPFFDDSAYTAKRSRLLELCTYFDGTRGGKQESNNRILSEELDIPESIFMMEHGLKVFRGYSTAIPTMPETGISPPPGGTVSAGGLLDGPPPTAAAADPRPVADLAKLTAAEVVGTLRGEVGLQASSMALSLGADRGVEFDLQTFISNFPAREKKTNNLHVKYEDGGLQIRYTAADGSTHRVVVKNPGWLPSVLHGVGADVRGKVTDAFAEVTRSWILSVVAATVFASIQKEESAQALHELETRLKRRELEEAYATIDEATGAKAKAADEKLEHQKAETQKANQQLETLTKEFEKRRKEFDAREADNKKASETIGNLRRERESANERIGALKLELKEARTDTEKAQKRIVELENHVADLQTKLHGAATVADIQNYASDPDVGDEDHDVKMDQKAEQQRTSGGGGGQGKQTPAQSRKSGGGRGKGRGGGTWRGGGRGRRPAFGNGLLHSA